MNSKKIKTNLKLDNFIKNKKTKFIKNLNVKDTPVENSPYFNLTDISNIDENSLPPLQAVSPIFGNDELFSWEGTADSKGNKYYGQVWISMTGRRHNFGDYYSANQIIRILMNNSGYIKGSESVPIDCDIPFDEHWWDNPPLSYVWHYVLMCGYPNSDLYNGDDETATRALLPYNDSEDNQIITWKDPIPPLPFYNYPVNNFVFGEIASQPVLLQLVKKEIHDATLPHYDSVWVWEHQFKQYSDYSFKYGD